MAEYRDKLLKEVLETPFVVGDSVIVEPKVFNNYTRSTCKVTAKITKLNDDDTITIVSKGDYAYCGEVTINKSECQKDVFNVGYNPFPAKLWNSDIERYECDIEGMMSRLGLTVIDGYAKDEDVKVTDDISVPELSFNPYVYDKDGNKQFYQRDYCWTIEDERLLIDSIYKGLDCGKILIRKRSWDFVESHAKAGDVEGLGFCDVVDGKQRLHTLHRFMNDKFTDSNGFYFSDLSRSARYDFTRSHCFALRFLGEGVNDIDTINCFLMVNFSGKPISKEHIDYVSKIQGKMVK